VQKNSGIFMIGKWKKPRGDGKQGPDVGRKIGAPSVAQAQRQKRGSFSEKLGTAEEEVAAET